MRGVPIGHLDISLGLTDACRGYDDGREGVLRPSLQIAGVIAPYRQAGIAADLNEPFTEVDVQEGDHVHAGQVLARQLVDDLEAQLTSSQRMVLRGRRAVLLNRLPG